MGVWCTSCWIFGPRRRINNACMCGMYRFNARNVMRVNAMRTLAKASTWTDISLQVLWQVDESVIFLVAMTKWQTEALRGRTVERERSVLWQRHGWIHGSRSLLCGTIQKQRATLESSNSPELCLPARPKILWFPKTVSLAEPKCSNAWACEGHFKFNR